MNTTARLILVALLSLGLMAGCATTSEEEATGPTAAEQAIAEAKAANEQAKAAGYEWRDTDKLIKEAEAAEFAGNDEEAIRLANKALKQAQTAIAQGEAENRKFLDSMARDDLADSASSLTSSSMAGKVTSYSVNRGDNLWNISGKGSVYANPYQWPLIYKNNRSQIKDADLIYPGQVFDIDQNASSSEINAAVRHAKSRGAWSVGDVEQSDLNYLNR